MKNKRILIFVIIVLGISACKKTVTVNIPHSSMITINYSNFTKDGGNTYYLDGSLKESKRISEGSIEFSNIYNATALVYENGVLVDSLITDPYTFQYSGKYLSNKFNHYTGLKTYKMVVSASGYKSATAEDIMPSQVPFTITLKSNAKKFVIPEVSSSPTSCDQIEITFTDPVATNDYYSFNLSSLSLKTGFLIFDADAEIDLGKSEPGTVTVLKYGTVFYQDKNFNGKQKTVQLYVPSQSGEDYKYILNSNHISKNLYKYQRSYINYQRTLGDPYSEPVLVYSNVNNGAGIFALRQYQTDTLR
ncbi:MAG: DUF4249 family protein [Bacteroidetes bacterium]|nr:DUF4249 family protein [Bacteroidota bacterium]